MNEFDRIDSEICIKAYDKLGGWFESDSEPVKEFLVPMTTDEYGEADPRSGQQRMRVHAELVYRCPSDRCDGFIARLSGSMLRNQQTLLVCFQGTKKEDESVEANRLDFVRYPGGDIINWEDFDPELSFDPRWPPHFPDFDLDPPTQIKPPRPGHPDERYEPDLPFTPSPPPSPPDTPSGPFSLDYEGDALPGFHFPHVEGFPPLPWPLVIRGFFRYGWIGEGADISPRKEYWSNLRDAVTNVDDVKVLFTGFSRGAAFASYMFADAIFPPNDIEESIGLAPPRFNVAKLYSFGAPATGEVMFHYGFRKYRRDQRYDGRDYSSFRIFNTKDTVPPPFDIGYPIRLGAKDGYGGHKTEAYEYLIKAMQPDASYSFTGVIHGQVVNTRPDSQ